MLSVPVIIAIFESNSDSFENSSGPISHSSSFDSAIIGLNSLVDFDKTCVSRPLNYLPKNKDFGSDIKIRIVLLKKK